MPLIEKESGSSLIKNFTGYSPERINPGDTKRKINQITKITSGSNKEIADFIDSFYGQLLMQVLSKPKRSKSLKASH